MNRHLSELKNFLLEKGINENELAPYLSGLKSELKNKKYGLVWEERPEENYETLKMNFPLLKSIKDGSLNIETSEELPVNLLLEGDNLHSLKVLEYTHSEAIDIIYIDPPYNTGKDFTYNDKLIKSDDDYRHSAWISFMNKRLRLAKELLKPEGVIFISINDREQAELKLLCDEIFHPNNFIANLNRKGTGGRQDSTHFSIVHEYVLCYARNIDLFKAGKILVEDREYPKYDEVLDKNYKTQLLRKWGDNSRREDRENLYYPLYVNFETQDIKVYEEDKDPDIEYVKFYPMLSQTAEGCWRWQESTMKENIEQGLVEFIETANGWVPYERIYENPEEEETKLYSSWIDDINSKTGTSLIKGMFGSKIFDYPKPVDFIKRLLKMGNAHKDAVILDFFAGSATTGQAVLELNNEDQGNRQFILCTNNEINKKDSTKLTNQGIEEGSEEWNDYGICRRITYPRLKFVIEGYETSEPTVTNLFKQKLSHRNLEAVPEYLNQIEHIKGSTEYDKYEVKIDDKQNLLLLGKNNKNSDVEGIPANLNFYEIYLEPELQFEQDTVESLMTKCSEIISIKEKAYRLIQTNENYDLIENNEKVVLIYKNPLALDYEVEEMCQNLNEYDKEKVVYSTKTDIYIEGVEVKGYPREIIRQLKKKISLGV